MNKIKILTALLTLVGYTSATEVKTNNNKKPERIAGFASKDFELHKSPGGVTIENIKLSGGAAFHVNSFKQLEEDSTKRRGYSFSMDSANINFEAKGKKTELFDYKLFVSMSATNTTDNSIKVEAEKVYLEFKSQFGTLETGLIKKASELMSAGPLKFIGGSGGVYGNWFSFAKSISGYAKSSDAKLSITKPNKFGKSWAVSYFSPRLNGVQFGYTLIPDEGNFDAKDLSYVGDFKNTQVMALNYKNQITEGICLEISVAGIIGNSTIKANKDLNSYSFGGVIKCQGFSFGAEYMDRGNSRIKIDHVNKGVNAGKVFTIGTGYEFDKNAVSLSYYNLKQRYYDGANAQPLKTQAYSVTYDRKIYDGLKVYLEGTKFNTKKESKSGNRGHLVLAGVTVSF